MSSFTSKSNKQHQQQQQDHMEPHPHDVLSGRGVCVSNHPGNLRFRALVQKRYDQDYCTNYSAAEKLDKAKEIIAHIQSLNPPGRFLKRAKHTTNPANAKGIQGPWIQLTKTEMLKRTKQALRDCNRPDRSGYATQVDAPPDVYTPFSQGDEQHFEEQQHLHFEDDPTALATHTTNSTPDHHLRSAVTPSTAGHTITSHHHDHIDHLFDPAHDEADFPDDLDPTTLMGALGDEHDPFNLLGEHS